jgi:hypothetical protein
MVRNGPWVKASSVFWSLRHPFARLLLLCRLIRTARCSGGNRDGIVHERIQCGAHDVRKPWLPRDKKIEPDSERLSEIKATTVSNGGLVILGFRRHRTEIRRSGERDMR